MANLELFRTVDLKAVHAGFACRECRIASSRLVDVDNGKAGPMDAFGDLSMVVANVQMALDAK